MDIVIKLSEVEVKALKTTIINLEEWSNYIIKDRARIEIDKIINDIIQYNLNNDIPLPSGTKEDIVMSADIKTAEEKQIGFESESTIN